MSTPVTLEIQINRSGDLSDQEIDCMAALAQVMSHFKEHKLGNDIESEKSLQRISNWFHEKYHQNNFEG